MRRQLRPLGLHLRSNLWEMTPRNHHQSDKDFRRRQVVSAVVVVIGAVVLGFSLRIDPDDTTLFYLCTLGLAVVWAVGAFASGPLHLGRIGHPAEPDLAAPRPVIQPIVLGAALAAFFVVGAFLIKAIPLLDDNLSPFIERVLEHANQGAPLILLVVTVVNGIAEELFFRGAMYAAIPKHQVPDHDHRLHGRDSRHRQRDARVRRDPAGRGRRPPAPRHRGHPGADPHPPDVVGGDALRAAGDLPRPRDLSLSPPRALLQRPAYGLP